MFKLMFELNLINGSGIFFFVTFRGFVLVQDSPLINQSSLNYASPELGIQEIPTLANLALKAIAQSSSFSLPPPARNPSGLSMEEEIRLVERIIATTLQKTGEDAADKVGYSCLNCTII